jgi:competence protein ComQ
MMDSRFIKEMKLVVDQHFRIKDLNDFLRVCIDEKVLEQSSWGETTLQLHYMLGGNSPYIYQLSAFTELLILALDIIDDLTDQDNLHKPWMKVPHTIALNASVAILIAALAEISKLKEQHSDLPLPLTGEINTFLTMAANGQHEDILNQTIETEEDYLRLIQTKSAPLLAISCYMGYSAVEHCEQSTKDKINEMVLHWSIAAQIHNDVNDLVRFDIKNDFWDKKRTFPVLYLLSECSERFPIFQDYYQGRVTREYFLSQKEEVIQHILQSGCVEYCKVVQGLYYNEIERIMSTIPGDPHWKGKFMERAFSVYK